MKATQFYIITYNKSGEPNLNQGQKAFTINEGRHTLQCQNSKTKTQS